MSNNNGSDTPVYYASHPTISIDGEVKDGLGDILLITLLVEETRTGLYRCEARFTNWTPMEENPFPFFDRELVDFGKTFAVEMGPPDGSRQIFNGRVMALEAQYPQQQPPEITILAEDRLQDLRLERRTRTFEDVSDEDVVNQIASQHGLTAEIDVDGPTYRVLTQLNQSDLAFLRERAVAIDAEVWVEDSTLYFHAHNGRSAGEVQLNYGGNLLQFSVLADLAHQRSSVKVSGWNVGDKAAIDVSAGESVVSGELNGHRGGSAILAEALAERHERIVTGVPLSNDEAQAMADARYQERARRFLAGSGIADGTPAMRVGTVVELSEVGELFNGRYIVTAVRHTFDRINGYRTTFEVERPGIGG